MANANQHIDIEAVLDGMNVINTEKAEIALILHLLSRYLYEIAGRELHRTDQMLPATLSPNYPLKIFTVRTGGGDSLEFIATRDENGFVVRVTFENGSITDRTTILHGRGDNRVDITPERLGAEFVGVCRHHLLPLFMEETAKRCTNPLLFLDLATFCAAAMRSAAVLEEKNIK